MAARFYSLIIPLYNRPNEIRELLESLLEQEYEDLEVLVVEDGSEKDAKRIVEGFQDQLNIHYYFKENSGPGFTRNYGYARAKGDYLIAFDSDCLIPPHYLQSIDTHLNNEPLDAFGGPDASHPYFTSIQKAIGQSMTSIFTTGGIRGKKQHVGQFHPRSFNMGISREVFEKTKGFSSMRYGEDLEFSMRIIQNGFKTGLIPEAFVYHKRRTSLRQFFWQVYHSGEARINLYKLYPSELKIVHFFPAVFTIFCLLTIIAPIFSVLLFKVMLSALLVYAVLIFIEAGITFKNPLTGAITVLTSFVQLWGYGTGFMKNVWQKLILKDAEPVTEYPD